MTPVELCRMVHDAGMRVRLEGDSLLIRRAELLTPELRSLLKVNKPALVDFLRQCHDTAAEVVREALLICDEYGDGPQARADMERDCQDTAPHLLPDLLDHLQTQNRGNRHQ